MTERNRESVRRDKEIEGAEKERIKGKENVKKKKENMKERNMKEKKENKDAVVHSQALISPHVWLAPVPGMSCFSWVVCVLPQVGQGD